MFKTRLKELRLENKMTQKELAAKINCDQSMIARWESGDNEPTATYIIKISKVFNTTADYLLGISDY
ncbi:MAG: helix-turn-helix domain-containing protein [Bacteroides sp.]|nr:helix-turn-helix domain-containing protein [Bacillota bacterium]MCM1393301.1 helix-turn-helix domain-containing protein [[Eubacterium] siraeum]MCM1455729.1 helix-turn-helix domain-containing protein [Bacteroides sp.]